MRLISNAASGSGTDAHTLAEALERRGATLTETEPERLVVAGGDGTVGQCAAGAAELGVPLAVLPTGTANDFARAHDIPLELEAALDLAAGGTRTRALELGTADGRPFVNLASAGLAPSAARRAEPLKGLLGPLAYPAGAIAAGVLDRPIRCTVGDFFEGEAWQVMVACSGAFGGGAEIDAADPADGRLDVVVLPAGPRIALARLAVALRRGDIADAPGVLHERVDRLAMTVPEETRFNVDGEVVAYGGTVEFAVRPGAFALVVA